MENHVKPSVYVETPISRNLTVCPSNDLRSAANQATTVEWWETRRVDFDLFISAPMLAGAAIGNTEAAPRYLVAIKNLTELLATEEAKILAKNLISAGSLLAKAELYAYHITSATVNRIKYLITWNHTHVAKTVIHQKVDAIYCTYDGFDPSIIFTLKELMDDLCMCKYSVIDEIRKLHDQYSSQFWRDMNSIYYFADIQKRQVGKKPVFRPAQKYIKHLLAA